MQASPGRPRFLPMLLRLGLLSLVFAAGLPAREVPPLPAALADYSLGPAPEPQPRLQKGDRLAICGDSITEQRQYSVTWGNSSRRYSAEELEAGVNLAKDFHDHPLVPAFKKVWDAVAAKQEYETRQIKNLVHGPEGRADLDATFALTEKARDRHVKALAAALQPADHQLRIEATP